MDDEHLNYPVESNIGSDSSTDNQSDDDELFDEIEEEWMQVFHVATTAHSTRDFFTSYELHAGPGMYINHAEGVKDVLRSMKNLPGAFKDLTNFTIHEWNELCDRVLPLISSHARSTGEVQILQGRPAKLTPEERLLNFVLYMKHDNTLTHDSHHWNWSRSSLCDDAYFVASCLNVALEDEIRWPTTEERLQLAAHNPDWPGCVGIIDGTLVKIRRPFHDEDHSTWFNGRKKNVLFEQYSSC